MKHVSVIVPAGEAVLSSIVGAYKIFNKVNEFLMATGRSDQPAFKVDLVGINPEQELYNGAFAVRPTAFIKDVDKTDLIIVTTIVGDIPKEIENNRPFVGWMQEMRAKHNTEIASLCMGAFLLAETGLLDGKSCATHWAGEAAFRMMYPQINLLPEKIISEDDGIYSSGGAYSFLNLLLHLVEKYSGRESAIWCSKMFEIEYNRSTQGQYIIFQGQKEHMDEPIKKAQLFIENNVGDRISVEDLARTFALSRRNFVRRFKKATANTPLEYIQRVKIEAAKRSFESTRETITEVMYAVGYNDTKAFRNIFRKYTGLTPKEYQLKYNREKPEVVVAP